MKKANCELRRGRILLSVIFFLLFQSSSHASSTYPVGEVEFLGASLTGEEIGLWLQKLPNIPKTIGLFSVKVQPPLDPEFANVIEAEVDKNVQAQNITKIYICNECRAAILQVKDDRVIITRGAPDLTTLKDLGKKLGVEAFLVLNVYRTKLSMITQASLYDVASGQLINADTFNIPALDIGDSAAQLLIKVGPGFKLKSKSNDQESSSTTPPIASNILILEGLGFAKGGLNIGGVFSSQNSFAYLMPTLGWRARFGGSSLSSLKSIGIGYGFINSNIAGSVGLSYDLLLGSFISVGLQAVGVVPIGAKENKSPVGFVGVTIGFSLGR